MKKIFLVCISFLCSCTICAQKSYSIHDLKKMLKGIVSQRYDAKAYPWEYSSFKDIYTKNADFYKKSTYITAKEVFIPLFESINKTFSVAGKAENLVIAGRENQKYIIVGSLYGGAQCLLDYIDQWKHDGIITEELLLQKNYICIFLGNAIGKSPYSHETLAIIGFLMQKNPHTVIYIQGDQEYQEEWVDHSLGDQITMTQKSSTASEYQRIIATFFSHYPRAIIINFDNKHSVLCTSSGKNAVKYAAKNIDIIFSGIDDFIIHENNNGLFLMPPIRGATNWKVFSACTPFMKEYYTFSTHSYIILDSKTLTHVYRKENEKKYQQDVYDVYTGLANNSKKKSSIRIGSSVDLSGQVKSIGGPLSEGIFVSLFEYNHDAQNKNFIREYIFDDGYIPYKTYKNINDLKKQGIDTIILSQGTVNLNAFVSEIVPSNLLVLFPLADGRYPDIKNLIHYRVSFSQEAEALVHNLLAKNYIKNVAIFYQNDAFGIGPRDVAHKILKEKNVNWVDVPYTRTDISFAAAAEKIKKSNVDAVVFFAIADSANALIREIKPYNLANKKLCGLSTLLLNGFDTMVYRLGLDFTFSAVVPDPLRSNLEIVKEYRTHMAQHAYLPDISSLEGYIGMQLFFDAFKAANYELDHKKIIRHFEQMNNTNFKGLLLRLNAFRGLSNTVWLIEGPSAEWISHSLA